MGYTRVQTRFILIMQGTKKRISPSDWALGTAE